MATDDGRPEGSVLKGGRPCFRAEGHPLADKAGYVGAARMVLHDHLEAEGVVAPVCHRCGRRVTWRRGGPGRTMKRAQRMYPLLVEYLDGDDYNVAPENLAPICSRCLHRYVKAPQPKDRNGLFTSR